MSARRTTLVFFRNDDVNRMEPGLSEMTQLLLGEGIGVSHAVEPANLTDEVRAWLLDLHPRGVEIVQHGYSHRKHDLGEFGGARPAEAQRADLGEGLRLMRAAFGDAFFPAMSFPYGLYNEHSVPILDELGYAVLSSHVRHQPSRRVFYRLGRLLRRGRWLGRHVSHHLAYYPGSKVFEISVAISPIRSYRTAEGPTACDFHEVDELVRSFRICRRQAPVVGIVLHHRYHATPAALDVLARFVAALRAEPGVEFTSLAGIHRQFAPAAGGGS